MLLSGPLPRHHSTLSLSPDLAAMTSPPASASPTAPTARLRLLATSDLHAHLTGTDFARNTERPGIGLAGLAPVIAQARRECDNCLLFDNGDLLEGTALGEEAAAQLGAGAPHAMIAALNALNFDGATPGNHDFGFGLQTACDAFSGANFPVVCANLSLNTGPAPWTEHALLRRELALEGGGSAPITIGIFGLLPPQVMMWEHRHLAGKAQATDMVEAARRVVPELEAAGADIIICLCHSGISTQAQPEAEDAAFQVAALPGVDAVIAGHKHRRFPGPHYSGPGVDPVGGSLAGTPAVMPGWRGSHLGVIDLDLVAAHDGWQLQGSAAELRAPSAHPSPQILRMAAPLEAAAKARLAQPIGHTDVPLHSFFAHLPGSSGLQAVARAARLHTQTTLGSANAPPVVAAVAPHKAGGFGGPSNYANVPQGAVAMRHTHDLYPYENQVAAFTTTGAVLLEWMERAATVFSTVPTGAQAAPLLVPGVYPGIFHHFEGVTATIDLRADGLYRPDEAAQQGQTPRVGQVQIDGAPLRPDTPLILVTNDHRLHGGGGVAPAPEADILFEGPQTMRDVLAAYLAKPDPASVAHKPPPWRFAPIGATVRYPTSPEARDHLDALPATGLELVEAAAEEDGFLWLTLKI